MPTTRRSFLQKCAIASVAAALYLHPSNVFAFAQRTLKNEARANFEIPYESKLDPVFSYTQATFEPYLKTTFKVEIGPARAVNLTLVKVTDRAPRSIKKSEPKSHGGECFSLLFSASAELSPLQQTYVLEHGALGKFSLFLVNASDPQKGLHYEAIINHITN